MDIFRRVGLAGPPTYSRAKKEAARTADLARSAGRTRSFWLHLLFDCFQRPEAQAGRICIVHFARRLESHTHRTLSTAAASFYWQPKITQKKRRERERARKRMESGRKCLELPLEDHEPWLVAGRTYLLSRELPAPAFTICHRALCLFVKKGRRRKEQSVYGFGSRGYEQSRRWRSHGWCECECDTPREKENSKSDWRAGQRRLALATMLHFP